MCGLEIGLDFQSYKVLGQLVQIGTNLHPYLIPGSRS